MSFQPPVNGSVSAVPDDDEFCSNPVPDSEVFINSLYISLAAAPGNLWSIVHMDKLGRKFFFGKLHRIFSIIKQYCTIIISKYVWSFIKKHLFLSPEHGWIWLRSFSHLLSQEWDWKSLGLYSLWLGINHGVQCFRLFRYRAVSNTIEVKLKSILF